MAVADLSSLKVTATLPPAEREHPTHCSRAFPDDERRSRLPTLTSSLHFSSHLFSPLLFFPPCRLTQGKVVLITGGNAGIGFAIAEACVKAGAARVIVLGRSAERVAQAVAKLGPTAVGEVADQASLDSIDAFIKRAQATYPVIDVLMTTRASPTPCTP